MMRAFRKRLGQTLLAVLVAIDVALQTLLVAPFALVALAPPPHPHATISGLLGRAMLSGRRWARFPAALVDALFLLISLGTEREHCVRVAHDEVSSCNIPLGGR